MRMEILEEARRTPLLGEYEVVVLGGAGLGAMLRHGPGRGDGRALDAPGMNMRGHVDVKYTMLMFAIILAIGADQLYRHRTGESLLALVPLWVWVAAAVAVALFLVLVAWTLRRKRPRLEVQDGRTVIHFDGRRLEVHPGQLEVRRWTTGGAFGQPLVRYMSLSRGAELVYEGRESDAERLLAAFEGLERARQ